MSEFFQAAFTMPTTVFSVLLILVGIYWLTVIVGLFDLELFDHVLGGAEGAVEGAAEGLLEGAVEGAAEGAAESLAAGAAEGVADGALDGLEGHGHHFLHRAIGIGEVPVTISLSLVIAFGWAFSYGGMEMVQRALEISLPIALGVGVLSLTLAFGATAIAIAPLRRLLRFEPATTLHQLVGKTCTVKTQRVDEEFGQAEIIDERGSVLLVQVRCATANELRRGSRALVFEYEPKQAVFQVTPVDEVLLPDEAASGEA